MNKRHIEKYMDVGVGLPRSYNRVGLIKDIDDKYKFNLSDSECNNSDIAIKSNENNPHEHNRQSHCPNTEKSCQLKVLKAEGIRDFTKIDDDLVNRKK